MTGAAVARVALVSNPSVTELFGEVAGRLAQQGIEIVAYASAAECVADLAGRPNVAAMLAMHDFPLTREFLESAPALRGVLSFVTGTEGFDEQAATDLGVILANGQIAENYVSMAEATIMLMLASTYDLRGAEHACRLNLERGAKMRASMLMGKTVGIVGFGKIASAVAERLATWDVRLQVYVPRLRSELPAAVQRVELDHLLQTSDFVVLLANLNADSRHILNGERLKLIKPGAILINTARGGLIDETQLGQLAAAGRFKAIALDTFEIEPLPLGSPLRRLDNAILTGHDVGHTVETHHKLVDLAVENLLRIIRGVAPLHVRNVDVVARWKNKWGS